MDRRRAATWVGLAAVLIAAALAYLPALSGPFQLDDWNAIQSSPRVVGRVPLPWPGPSDLLGSGRVLTEATFAADWRASGGDPFRFHAVGLALHLAATVAAFLLAGSLLRRARHPRADAIALVAAGVFALHPIQAEAVAYAAQRSEVLAALLGLVSLLLLDRSALGARRAGRVAAWAGGAAGWVAAMAAKSVAIAIPGVFVLDQGVVAPGGPGTPGPGRRLGRALLLASPLLALATWSAVLHLRAFEASPGGGAGFTASTLGAGRYLLTQLRVQWLYLRLLAWPDPLGLDRSFTASEGWDAATTLAAAGVAAAVGLAGWLWWRAERAPGPAPARRIAAFGILFWLVVLSPTSSFVPVVDLAVEHRVYLAMLGPVLAATVGLDALAFRLLRAGRSRAVAATVAAVVLAALAVALHARAGVWRSAEALWRDADRTSPGSPRILTNLGLALQMKGDLEAADASYRAAWKVAREPLHVVGLARNHSSLLVDGGHPEVALLVLERGLAVDPGDPELLGNRAAALAALGRWPEAATDARRAVGAAPSNPFFREVLGQILFRSGDLAGAAAQFAEAARLDPGQPSYVAEQVRALLAAGHLAEGCAAFRAFQARAPATSLPADLAQLASTAGCPRN